MTDNSTISRKPYLLRAMVEWAEDNGWTPMLVVDAEQPDVQVPQAFVEEGRITLNISYSAMHQREMSNDAVTGSARFGGRSEYLYLPLPAIAALIVRETGEVMMLPDDEPLAEDESAENEAPPQSSNSENKRPTLSAVRSVEPESVESSGEEPDDEPPKPPRGRPQLKIVK